MARLPPPPPRQEGYYDKLNPDQQRFVKEYLIDLNGNAASLRAGYAHSATGWRLLRDPMVKQAISEQRDLVARERGANGGHFVLGKLWDVATADPRELAEVRRVPCRYCHGINGQYQFTKTEHDRLVKAYEYGTAKLPFNALWPSGPAERAAYVAGANKIPLDPQGGDGYTTQREVNDQCPECGGIGISLYYIADTRKLTEKGRQLYRGVKVGKDKIEVLMADQDAAIKALAKHYGVATERREVWLRTLDPNKLSDDDLMRAVAELEQIELERSEYRTIDVTPAPDPEAAAVAKHWRQQAVARARHMQQAKGKGHKHSYPLGVRRSRPKGAKDDGSSR